MLDQLDLEDYVSSDQTIETDQTKEKASGRGTQQRQGGQRNPKPVEEESQESPKKYVVKGERQPQRSAATEENDQDSGEADRQQKKRKKRPKKSKVATGEEAVQDDLDDAPVNKRPNTGKARNPENRRKKPEDEKKDQRPCQYVPYIPQRKFKSRYAEYNFAEWRRYHNNMFVTIDTIVPTIPSKILEEPDETKYRLSYDALEEEIERLQAERKDARQELYEQEQELRTDQVGRNPIRQELKDLYKEQNFYFAEKNARLKVIEGVQAQITNAERNKQKEMKRVHPVYNRADRLKQGIKDLEKRMSTTTLSRAEELKTIKEIETIKQSEAVFADIEKIQNEVDQLKAQKKTLYEEGAPNNQILSQLRDKITEVKKNESKYDHSKQLISHNCNLIREKVRKANDEISELLKTQYQTKEDYYGAKCDFEIQARFLKDIEFISRTKLLCIDREEKNSQYQAEQRERKENYRKRLEERKRIEAENLIKQQERKKQIEEEEQKWRDEQLEKLQEHPFTQQIDTIEQLIYFCAKHALKEKIDDPEAAACENHENHEQMKEKAKQTEKIVKVGNNEVTMSRAEKQAVEVERKAQQSKGKHKKRDRDGPSSMYYEDGGFDLVDLNLAQVFGSVDVSPPGALEDMSKTYKVLIDLRDALKLCGSIDQAEGNAKFTGNKEFIQSEEFKDMKKNYEALDYSIRRKVEAIKHKAKFGTELNTEKGEVFEPEQRKHGYRRENPGKGRDQQDPRGRKNNQNNQGKKSANDKKQNNPIFSSQSFPAM